MGNPRRILWASTPTSSQRLGKRVNLLAPRLQTAAEQKPKRQTARLTRITNRTWDVARVLSTPCKPKALRMARPKLVPLSENGILLVLERHLPIWLLGTLQKLHTKGPELSHVLCSHGGMFDSGYFACLSKYGTPKKVGFFYDFPFDQITKAVAPDAISTKSSNVLRLRQRASSQNKITE